MKRISSGRFEEENNCFMRSKNASHILVLLVLKSLKLKGFFQ